MKLTLFEVQRAQKAFQKIMNAELPARVAFRLSRMGKVIDGVYMEIEAQRANLVKKYGTPTDDGITVDKENINTFQDEFGELLAKESVDLDIEPLKLELLESLKLSAIDMMALEPFIEE